MIQGLLAAVMEERKLPVLSGGFLSEAHSPFLTAAAATGGDVGSMPPSSASAVASPLQVFVTASSPSTASEVPQQNLRCPRCDSSNTKFCYYNNYNLTQPRHFCKTCRRYWTKGGALRNVPIGGGCRKAKPGPVAAAKFAKPVKPILSMDCIGPGGLVVDPFRFPVTNNASHLLSLLRAGGGGGVLQIPNHNSLPALNGIRIKDEPGVPAGGVQALPGLSLDPFETGSLWRHDGQFQYLQPQQSNTKFSEVEAGIHELYHRLQSPTMPSTVYCGDHLGIRSGWLTPASSSLEPMSAMTTTAVAGLEPVVGGELGYSNPWSDMSTSN